MQLVYDYEKLNKVKSNILLFRQTLEWSLTCVLYRQLIVHLHMLNCDSLTKNITTACKIRWHYFLSTKNLWTKAFIFPKYFNVLRKILK